MGVGGANTFLAVYGVCCQVEQTGVTVTTRSPHRGAPRQLRVTGPHDTIHMAYQMALDAIDQKLGLPRCVTNGLTMDTMLSFVAYDLPMRGASIHLMRQT